MRKLSNHLYQRNRPLLPLSLFASVTCIERDRLSLAVRSVALRCGLSPPIATVVAERMFTGDQ